MIARLAPGMWHVNQIWRFPIYIDYSYNMSIGCAHKLGGFNSGAGCQNSTRCNIPMRRETDAKLQGTGQNQDTLLDAAISANAMFRHQSRLEFMDS